MDLNNPENLSTTKVRHYIRSGFYMSPILSCKSIENNDDAYWGKDRMKKFSKPLRSKECTQWRYLILKRHLKNPV